MKVSSLLAALLVIGCTKVLAQRVQPSPGASTPKCLPLVRSTLTIEVRFTGDLCPARGARSDFLTFLAREIRNELLDEIDLPDNCRYRNFTLVRGSCVNSSQLGQRRGKVLYSVTVVCGSRCLRSRDFKAYDTNYKLFKGNLRTAKRQKDRVDTTYGSEDVRIFYNRGKKTLSKDVCSVGDLLPHEREKFNLCACPDDCIDVCQLPADTGPCRAAFPRYFFNNETGRCELFTYGGCQGNQNNFKSRAECMNECAAPTCPSGKVFQECGTACPETCNNTGLIIPCTLQCVVGCFCPPGMVELDTQCVQPEECPARQCPNGKVFQECGTACPETCDNTGEPIFCTRQCVRGCFCPNGTVEIGEICVLPEECPPKCPGGKVYRSCGTACPETCNNTGEAIVCTKQCAPGCFCPDGTVELGDECVTPELCPPKECPEGKVFLQCGSACPDTCDNKDELRICPAICISDCFCPNGTVELGDECVAPEDCPTNATEECPNGKVFNECGTACPETCENTGKLIFCTRQCVRGCFCPEGTVEMGDVCVTPDECPKECPNGKEYQQCGTACPKNCDNKDEIVPCPLICVQGCFCPEGTVEMGDECVTPDECPKECPNGKEYQECGTACPINCDNKDEIVPCPLICVQGCFCPTDMVELGEQCVHPSQCPSGSGSGSPLI